MRLGRCVLGLLLIGCSSAGGSSSNAPALLSAPGGTLDPDAGSRPPVSVPALGPLVRAAAPAGFSGPVTSAIATMSLSLTDIKQRFFSAGPTNLWRILDDVDGRVQGLVPRAAACLAGEPVRYFLHPFGADVPFYAQCVERVGPGFVQIGQKDGATYLYSAVGAGWTAAVVTAEGEVAAWVSVGQDNATSCGGFDACSYGVIQLRADARSRLFELAVAGIGFGYCGAQIKSDGASVWGKGSPDQGTTCADADSFCVSASDVMSPAECGDDVKAFSLPPLGRKETTGDSTWAASAYPGGAMNAITLDGTSTDSLHFGPAVPTDGVPSL